MRQIKFRAWEKNLKEMIPVHSINFENNMINTESAWRLFSEIELMQFTGLNDKNDKEIYEGDIVQYKQRNLDAAFGFAEGEDYIEKTRKISYKDQSFNVPAGFIKDLEVVGNIYEGVKN